MNPRIVYRERQRSRGLCLYGPHRVTGEHVLCVRCRALRAERTRRYKARRRAA